MKTIEIPYYTSHQELHVDEKNLKAVIRAKMHEFKTEKTEAEIVKEAMDHPIGTLRSGRTCQRKKECSDRDERSYEGSSQ